MTRSATTTDFAKTGADKTALSADGMAPNQVLISKIRELFPRDTVKALAAWLKCSMDTARNRLKGNREFNLDEIVQLLHSEHGFEILCALMSRVKRPPRWWRVCMPLMDLADAERMVAVVRKRTQDAILNREETIDALETEIRRAQAAAIHDPEFAGPRLDAFGAMARVVAPKKR